MVRNRRAWRNRSADDAAEVAAAIEVDDDRLPLQIFQPDAVPLADGEQVERRGALADAVADGGRADILGVGALVELTARGKWEGNPQRQQ